MYHLAPTLVPHAWFADKLAQHEEALFSFIIYHLRGSQAGPLLTEHSILAFCLIFLLTKSDHVISVVQ